MIYWIENLGNGSIEQGKVQGDDPVKESWETFSSQIEANARVIEIQEALVMDLQDKIVADDIPLTPEQIEANNYSKRTSDVRSLMAAVKGTPLDPYVEKIFIRFAFEINLFEKIESGMLKDAINASSIYDGDDPGELEVKAILNAESLTKGFTVKQTILYKLYGIM